MTDLDLDAIKARHPNKWHICPDCDQYLCDSPFILNASCEVEALVAEVERLKRERNRFGKLADRASRDRQSLVAEVERLRAALSAARDELSRWGWGDFHYSNTGRQEQRVVDAVAAIDAALHPEEHTP